MAARENIVETSQSAALIGLRCRMQRAAEMMATAAKNQKTAVTIYSPRGSVGSHRVETGCVCEESRSRS